MEQRLPGGRNDGALRVGDTVRRRTGEHTSGVHALLTHLRAVGFTRAPRVLGLDEHGREVLSFLDGESVGAARPWPGWAHSDAALVAVGGWLRAFHAASATFVPPSGARWFGDHDQLGAGEVIGHHDAAPYNAVWRPAAAADDTRGGEAEDGELVGFVDWDLDGASSPLWDLAFVVLMWVPLTARDVAAADGFPAASGRRAAVVERGRRLGLLLEACGWRGGAGAVLAAVRRRASEHAVGLRAAARSGYGPAVALVGEGVADAFDRAVLELDADAGTLAAAVEGRSAPAAPQASHHDV